VTQPNHLLAALAAVLLGLASPLSAQQPQVVAPEVKDPPPVAGDSAVLELELPKGARAALDGADVGERRKFEFNALGGGAWRAAKLTGTLADGAKFERSVVLKGGWRVPLRVREAADGPSPVVQTGHKSCERAVFSPDGNYVLTSGSYYSDDRPCLFGGLRVRLRRRFPPRPHAQ
jgi:hypothetical protein